MRVTLNSQRIKVGVVLTSLCFNFLPSVAFAFTTPKPNAPCSDAGYFGIANGQMMTCVSTGSSLAWRLEKNVIAGGGECSAWTPGDMNRWAELQLFLGGKWVTQAVPIAFTPGPPCDTSKSNSSIPWIALPNKIAEGTKFRWVHGESGKDGHGGRMFYQGFPDPAFTYSSKDMQAPSLKVYTAVEPPVVGPHTYVTSNNQLPSADVTSIPNAACSSAGYFGIANGQMMTCVKSGSSLKWKLEKNVIVGGLCTSWKPGELDNWAELELFLNNKWVTQALPIAFTPGPACDQSTIDTSIPWIALPFNISEGTQYRWVQGRSGHDGHGGRKFNAGFAGPVLTYSSAASQVDSFKIYKIVEPPVIGPHVYFANKPGVPIPVITPPSAQVPSVTPTPSSTPSPVVTPTIKPAENSQSITLPQFAQAASVALNSSSSGLPTLDANPPVIQTLTGDTSAKFIPADSYSSMSYIGPNPILWSNNAVSLISQDANSNVYASNEGNLPPWAAMFEYTTSDPRGRIVLKTSGFPSDIHTYTWRLAYKKAGGNWQYANLAGNSHPATTTPFFDEISLGGAGQYSVHLEFDGHTVFYGIGLDNTAQVTALSAASPRVLIIGDSWVYPVLNESGPWTAWDAFPGALSYLTGWNVISDGVRGQGYLRSAGGATYKDRIDADIAPQDPDVVIFTGSPNDFGANYTAEQIATELGNDIQLMRTKDPRALLIVCSQFDGPVNINVAMKQIAQSLNTPYIDFITQPLFNSSNNGSQQLLNGHPTKSGSLKIAQELLKHLAQL